MSNIRKIFDFKEIPLFNTNERLGLSLDGEVRDACYFNYGGKNYLLCINGRGNLGGGKYKGELKVDSSAYGDGLRTIVINSSLELDRARKCITDWLNMDEEDWKLPVL